MTDEPASDEASIAADIAGLKQRYPRTQDLYREACILLFFRHGITPTANKLYQLVRKGSMSAPTQAVHEFWDRLRETSRIKVEHAELPEELKAAAGEMVATLWQSAQEASRAMLVQYQNEATEQVMGAKAGQAQAQAELAAMVQELNAAESRTRAQEELVLRLRQELSAAAAINAGLEARLEELRRQVAAMHEATEQLRMDHAVDTEKLVARMELAEQRYGDMEKRALVEVDRERTASAKLQKTLESERVAHAQVVERLRTEHNAAQSTIGQLREQVASSQKAVTSLETQRHRDLEDLSALRIRMEAAIEQAAAGKARADQLQSEVERYRTVSENRRRDGATANHEREQRHTKGMGAKQPGAKVKRTGAKNEHK